jgi:hypothetical protein
VARPACFSAIGSNGNRVVLFSIPASLLAIHLMTLVPTIVEDTLIFYKLLDKIAGKQEIVQLDHMTAHLTIDIMGHLILDYNLNCQTEKNELVETLKKTMPWMATGRSFNPFANLRLLAHWYYANQPKTKNG